MWFEVEGYYELPRSQTSFISKSPKAFRQYWEEVDEKVPGLSKACGCYIFAILSGRGMLPWYVGKAEKQSFKNECLTVHKLNRYNEALSVRRNGRPVLFFFPELTEQGIRRKPTTRGRSGIQFLEWQLIGMALKRNSELLNIKGVKPYRDLTVRGFINSNSKQRTGAIAEARKLFGIRK